MHLLFSFLASILLMVACTSESDTQDKGKSPSSGKAIKKESEEKEIQDQPKVELPDNSTMLKEAEKLIRKAYSERLEELGTDFGKDLQLEGSVTFENDELLIISFEEIVEYGSWMYSNSSLFYAKSSEGYKLLKPKIKTTTLNWGEETNLQYPGRVNGVFKNAFDLTNNGEKDFILEASGGFRTNEWNTEYIVVYNRDQQSLRVLHLKAVSNVTVGECSDRFGQIENFEILEPEAYGGMPLLKIKGGKSECVNDTVKVINTYENVYVYDLVEEQFVLFQ